jgi:predicted dehydrogenase
MSTDMPSRREFMQRSAMLGAGTFAILSATAMAQDAQPIRVGLVGTGRRGTGAARDCIESSPNVKLVAMCDLFDDHLQDGHKKLSTLGDAYQVTEETMFTGWDGYQKVIESDVDLVILAVPPGFRPQHLRACVEAGKHVFTEKPAAVDTVGVRSIIESGRIAKDKGLAIVAGTQRRHQAEYVSLLPRIHEGAIGDITSAECYWVGDYEYYTAVPREPEWSDMEWQLRNWNYFTWLSGDHIVEQHVHNIDIINWAMQQPPTSCFGMGGRQQRTDPAYGHIYDHFAVEFEYPGGVRVQSYCRQMKDVFHRVTERVVGTKGIADPKSGISGENPWQFDGEKSNPYVQEHADLIASIRSGQPLNEAEAIATSTMMAVMGRMACYTGQEVTWDFVMNESKLDLTPEKLEFGEFPTPPVAIPGETELV